MAEEAGNGRYKFIPAGKIGHTLPIMFVQIERGMAGKTEFSGDDLAGFGRFGFLAGDDAGWVVGGNLGSEEVGGGTAVCR